MSKKESPLGSLADFLPRGAFPLVEPFLLQYKVHLTITRERASVLGDYRNAVAGKAHRISVNGNLNPYAFLITLLHELAHLITFIKFGHKVSAHGREWQMEFALLLKQFLLSGFFPEDIGRQLNKSLKSPAASSCADTGLMRVLRNYDPVKDGHCLVEELQPGELFEITKGRVFRMEGQQRKRFKALELSTKRLYLFSPVYEVKKVLLSE
jgi:hypothetical protein